MKKAIVENDPVFEKPALKELFSHDAAKKAVKKRRSRVRESQVEAAFVARVKELGGIAPKFVSPGRRSVPDRLALLPGGQLVFCELKRPGEVPTDAQLREHARLRELGFRVDVVDTIEGARSWAA